MASATDLKDHPVLNIHPVEQFVTERVSAWREEAAHLEQRGLREAAALMESLADELESTAEASLEEMLTLAEAAETSGYSYSSLERMVRRGEIPNAGAKGSPRIRRRDLPRRPPHEPPTLATKPQKTHSDLGADELVEAELLAMDFDR